MDITVRNLPLTDYQSCYSSMKRFTENRESLAEDEIWFVQHHPVFTLGMVGKHEHILHSGDVPVIQSDRGGQVTYHGPGQMVCYLLLDLKRKGLGPKDLVLSIEQAIIDFLAGFKLEAERISGAPGVYIKDKKIAALGIRVRRGLTYHGLSLNINMDLSPFKQINPCGYPGLEVIQLSEFSPGMSVSEAEALFLPQLLRNLDYETYNVSDEQVINRGTVLD